MLIPEEAPWLVDFLDEMSQFPKGQFNDQMDMFTQGIEYLKRMDAGLYISDGDEFGVGESEVDGVDWELQGGL